MKVLIDEDLPVQLKGYFGDEHEVSHVEDIGLKGIPNGSLFREISGVYDVLVSADKSQRFQQNLALHDIALILVRPERKVIEHLVALMPAILAAIPTAPRRAVTVIEPIREPFVPE